MSDIRPKSGWLMKAGQKASEAGWRDIVVQFGTVPPKAGRLRPSVILQALAKAVHVHYEIFYGIKMSTVTSNSL